MHGEGRKLSRHMARLCRVVCLVALFTLMPLRTAWGQEGWPVASYPYGCTPDQSLDRSARVAGRVPPLRCTSSSFTGVQFDSLALFSNARFDSIASFSGAAFDAAFFVDATFNSRASFGEAAFESAALFDRAVFSGPATFEGSTFSGAADFIDVEFGSGASFSPARFERRASFFTARFEGLADFDGATFEDAASFKSTRFEDGVTFRGVTFTGRVDFRGASIDSIGVFDGAAFEQGATFEGAALGGAVDFSSARYWGATDFWDALDFRGARFGGDTVADFSRASVRDTIHIGSWDEGADHRFDFRRVNFLEGGREARPSDTTDVDYPGAAVVLHGPADVQLQVEKFDFLRLADGLSYFDKRDIVTYLKTHSFDSDGQEVARFELDYLLARSTMHQGRTGTHEAYSWHDAQWWLNVGYYYLMGFGYRPFRIFLWAGVMVLAFAVFYRLRMADDVHAFVQNNGEDHAPRTPSPPAPKPAPFQDTTWDITLGRFTIGRIAPRTSPNGPSSRQLPSRQLSSEQLSPMRPLSQPTASGNPDHASMLTPWIHCLYFSTMVVFTLRLNRKILTFFDAGQQRIIVTQWVAGFTLYVLFLTLAKSGSILHQLKTLFVG